MGQKKSLFVNKDHKTNFDACMILQKPVLSFKDNDFLKMANLKMISSSATLSHNLLICEDYSSRHRYRTTPKLCYFDLDELNPCLKCRVYKTALFLVYYMLSITTASLTHSKGFRLRKLLLKATPAHACWLKSFAVWSGYVQKVIFSGVLLWDE